MSDLVAIIYPSEQKAEEVRQRLFKLQREYLITISDAVIAVKTEAGPVKLNQLMNTTMAGAASGSFWGLLVGVLFLNGWCIDGLRHQRQFHERIVGKPQTGKCRAVCPYQEHHRGQGPQGNSGCRWHGPEDISR
jgi:hypothetical protein